MATNNRHARSKMDQISRLTYSEGKSAVGQKTQQRRCIRKKVKIMLTAIAVLAAVGGALAFKAKKKRREERSDKNKKASRRGG